MLKLKVSILLIFIFVLGNYLVLASFPGIPHQFYGDVEINGLPATNGIVEVKINDEEAGAVNILNGKYGYDPIFLIKDPDSNLNGKLIIFYVNGVESSAYVFENGGVTKLDLSIEVENFCGDGIIMSGEKCDDGENNGVKCNNSEEDCEYCTTSCKIIELKYKEEDDKDKEEDVTKLIFSCSPNWKCGAWSECVEGMMTRTCEDTNNCGLSYNKPAKEMGCESTFLNPVFLEPKQESIKNLSRSVLILISFIIIITLAILANWKLLKNRI